MRVAVNLTIFDSHSVRFGSKGEILASETDFRYGSKADVMAPKSDFCFTPESGLNSDITACPVPATDIAPFEQAGTALHLFGRLDEALAMAELMEPAKLKAATTYNAAADHFDDGPLAFWDRYGQRTIERLRLKPGSVILDVGCGSGASAIPAAIAVQPHGWVIAVDLADRLLALARTKAAAQKLENIEFRQADMEALGYPDETFNAVVCVFAIFFVPDMVKQVRELWRMVRGGEQLAITTWGPRMFEPGSAAWWAAVKQFRPDLHTAFNPWERIITPQAVSQLLSDSGIRAAEIIAEDGQQVLRSPDDWWTVVQGSGYRWTLEQMDNETIARVRDINLEALRDSETTFIETNVIYAVVTKT